MRLTIDVNLRPITAKLQGVKGIFNGNDTMRGGYRRAGAVYLAFIRRRYLSAARGDGTWPDLAESTKLNRMRRGRTKKLRASEKRALLDEAAKSNKQKKRRTAPKSASERRVVVLTKQIKRLRGKKGGRVKRRLEVLKNKLSIAQSTAQTQKGLRSKLTKLKQAGVTGKFEILRDTGLGFSSLSEGASGNVMKELPDGIACGTNIDYMRHHQDPKIAGRPPQRKILVPPDADTVVRIRAVLQRAANEALRELKG